MAINGVMFDLDGTLLDSTSFWESVGESYIISKGLTPDKDIRKDLTPLDALHTAMYFKEKYNLPESVEEIFQENCEIVSAKYYNDFKLKPGVKEFLEKLKGKNVKMCVVTLTEKEFVIAALKRLGVEDYFCDIITTGETGLTKKSPEIFDYAVDKMGVKKERALLFEDSIYSIISAKKGGYKTVGVHDENLEETWNEIKDTADYYINSFYDIKEISLLFGK